VTVTRIINLRRQPEGALTKPAALHVLFGRDSGRPKGPTADSNLPKWTAPTARDTFEYATANKEESQTVVESLINGGQIFGKVANLLDNAKSSVMVDLYNLQSPTLYPEKSSVPGTPGATEQAQLVDRLVALKRKGLNVKVVLDGHWDTEFNEKYNGRTVDYLRSQGVEVLTYPNFSKISHVKLLVVDDKFAVIGGMNWGNHSASNHDAAVFIEGPDVRNLYNKIFKTDWVTSGGSPEDIPDVPDFEPGKIKVLTTSQSEAADGGSQDIFEEIMSQIGKAQESIYAELFVLTQSDIIDNLIFTHKRLKKAGKEGVKILVDPGLFFSFPNTRKGVQKIAAAGVPIQFYKANRDIDEKLHAKWAVFDKKTVIIGSANWSAVGLLSDKGGRKPVDDETLPKPPGPRSPGGNHEADVLIESKAIAKAFVDQFWFDWRNRSFPMLVKKDDGSGGWKRLVPDPQPNFA
jgi:phosphatidylserine/phosphatidylglycerophosphate/cardiolipin synthase-like enzyme